MSSKRQLQRAELNFWPDRLPFSCFLRWRSRLVCWPKQRSHKWHLKGFSLLWMLRMWRWRLEEMLKERSQNLHLQGKKIWGLFSRKLNRIHKDWTLHANSFTVPDIMEENFNVKNKSSCFCLPSTKLNEKIISFFCGKISSLSGVPLGKTLPLILPKNNNTAADL